MYGIKPDGIIEDKKMNYLEMLHKLVEEMDEKYKTMKSCERITDDFIAGHIAIEHTDEIKQLVKLQRDSAYFQGVAQGIIEVGKLMKKSLLEMEGLL